MTGRRRLAAAVAGLVLVGLGGCGGSDDPGPTTAAQPQPPPRQEAPDRSDASADQTEQRIERSGDPERRPERPGNAEERAVTAALDRYIGALNAADGERLCALLAPGATDGLKLPVERGSCERSFSQSIGYRDPRGFPQFERSDVQEVIGVEIDGERARATATVTTEFRDRQQVTIEDDVVYFVRRGGDWLVAKPSATLYRAIGRPDVPLDALEPPS